MLNLNHFHDYQHNAVTMLYEHEGMLAVMPCGGGKTAVGLTAFSELQRDGHARKCVLLAPKRVALTVWPAEPQEWQQLQHLVVTALQGTPQARATALQDPATDVYALGLDNIKWLAEQMEDWEDDDPRLDILIVDEISRCKNPRGVWAKTLRKISKRFRTVWMLTGSPRPNGEEDYFVAMAIASREKLWGKSFDRWRRQYFYPIDFHQRQWVIHSYAEPKINADVAKYSFRVPLSAVPRPASDPIIHKVRLPKDARVQYKRMERELFATIGETDIVAFNSAVSSGKLAQIAQGFLYDEESTAHSIHHAKTAMVEELLAGMQGDATALVYWFKEDLARLKDLIPGLVCIGGVSDQQVLEIEKEWNSGCIEHLAIHPAAASHGMNLQKTQAQLIHYTLTWSAELYEQVVARIARQGYAGNKENWQVMNHHIVAEDTVDEAKILRVKNKMTAQEAAMAYIRSV